MLVQSHDMRESVCVIMQSRDPEEVATPSGQAEPEDFLDSLLETSYTPQRPGQVPPAVRSSLLR